MDYGTRLTSGGEHDLDLCIRSSNSRHLENRRKKETEIESIDPAHFL